MTDKTEALIGQLERCKADISDNDIHANAKKFVWDCAIEEVRHYFEVSQREISLNDDKTWYSLLNAFNEAKNDALNDEESLYHAFQAIRSTKREYKRVHGYEISGNTIYIGPMRPDHKKVNNIVCTIDWDETYTEEAKARRIKDAERICRGLDHE